MKNNINVLNAQEAGHFLGAHVETIRRLARKGDIPAYKIGKDWRFRREALLRWAEESQFNRQAPYVLVIDDEESFRTLIIRFLKPEGYRVLQASSGREGLSLLSDHSVDLILLDLKMPEMNGPEFLRRCRKTNPNLPVIIVTGYPDSDLMAEAMRYGPITLVAKPIEREQIMQAVGSVLSGARETKDLRERIASRNGREDHEYK